jgi:hypothetical protein
MFVGFRPPSFLIPINLVTIADTQDGQYAKLFQISITGLCLVKIISTIASF